MHSPHSSPSHHKLSSFPEALKSRFNPSPIKPPKHSKKNKKPLPRQKQVKDPKTKSKSRNKKPKWHARPKAPMNCLKSYSRPKRMLASLTSADWLPRPNPLRQFARILMSTEPSRLIRWKESSPSGITISGATPKPFRGPHSPAKANKRPSLSTLTATARLL